MIQDIYPAHLDNAFRNIQAQAEDPVLCFAEGCVFVNASGGRLSFPKRRDFAEDGECIYAFSAAGRDWYLMYGACEAPDRYEHYSLHQLREMELSGNLDIFIVYTGFHLWKWYTTSRFCGACGRRTVPASDERAMVCPECGNRIYPRINPAVIVGVINGDRILITKYKSGFRHNALIAGFTEIGETVEETVRREVMEETGLRVKNIRYYKSQPWGIASDILMGFYCDVDGSTEIHRDDRELGYAEWVERKDIILQPSDHSLTNEMMKKFMEGYLKRETTNPKMRRGTVPRSRKR